MALRSLTICLALAMSWIMAPVAKAAPIPGAMLWLDASDASSINGGTPSNNDPVSLWGNLEGAASNATQGTAARQPIWIQSSAANGRSVVRFDGSPTAGLGDEFAVTGLGLGANATIFVVALNQTQTTDGGSSIRPMFSEATNFSALGYALSFTNAAEPPMRLWVTKHGAHNTSLMAHDSLYHFYTLRSNASPGATEGYDNGALVSSGALGGSGAGTTYTIGGDTNVGARHYFGDIGEMIAYASVLNTAQMAITNNYLSAKYNAGTLVGLDRTLGVNDRYEGDLNARQNYDLGVFGIGAESDGTVSTGSFGEGLNLAESGGSLATGDYLLAGHDGTAHGMTGGIWDRVWFLDKTQTLDATLTFDFGDAGLSLPGGGEFSVALLYSATDPFSFTALPVTGTISGDQVSFTVPNALLLDGYYTLQVIAVPEPSTGLLLGLSSLGLAWSTRRRRPI